MKYKLPDLLKYLSVDPRFKRSTSYLLSCSRRFKALLLTSVIPNIHATAYKVVDRLTYEDGSSEWASLSPSNRWNRYIIWTLVGVSTFGVTWSLFARIDETVSATGKLEPLGTTIDVKAPIGGVIKNILVVDGQSVQKDQILLELDTTAARARLDALRSVKERTSIDLLLSKSQLGIPIDQSQLNENQLLRLSALKSEFLSRISASQNAVSQAESQYHSYHRRLTAKQKSLKIRENILKDIFPLVDQGAMARSQYLKELQEVELLRGEVNSLLSNINSAKAAIAQAEDKLSNTKSLSLIDFSTKVDETEKQIAQLENQISETLVTLQYQAIRAPKDGLIFDLQASTPGYVVNSDRPILKLVPTDSLVARVFVSNKDIGFVRVGQNVKIRIDAYSYNEFGGLDGTIKSIGSDVLEPDENYNFYRFPVSVSIPTPSLVYKGRTLPLLSGMSLNAVIILRQRPVISIFTQRILPFWDSLEKL